jgi:hypothetical protein
MAPLPSNVGWFIERYQAALYADLLLDCSGKPVQPAQPMQRHPLLVQQQVPCTHGSCSGHGEGGVRDQAALVCCVIAVTWLVVMKVLISMCRRVPACAELQPSVGMCPLYILSVDIQGIAADVCLSAELMHSAALLKSVALAWLGVFGFLECTCISQTSALKAQGWLSRLFDKTCSLLYFSLMLGGSGISAGCGACGRPDPAAALVIGGCNLQPALPDDTS